MLGPKTDSGSVRNRGERIDTKLSQALNSSASKDRKITRVPLDKVSPNPNNKRRLRIPLDEMLEALKIGRDDSLVKASDGKLVFPELSELEELGVELNIRTQLEELFYEKIRELAISIFNRGGLISPVELVAVGKNEPSKADYVLGLGHRRWFACHFVPDMDVIDSFIKSSDQYTPLEGSVREWDENDKRDDNTLLERLEIVEEVWKHLKAENSGRKVKQTELASVLSLSKHDASYFAKIIASDLQDRERELLENNKLNDLKTVADICRIESTGARYKAFLIYESHGNTAARKFVKQQLESDAPKKPSNPPVPRAKKFSPSPTGVSRLYEVLEQQLPDLVKDIDHDADPADIIIAILERLEKEQD